MVLAWARLALLEVFEANHFGTRLAASTLSPVRSNEKHIDRERIHPAQRGRHQV